MKLVGQPSELAAAFRELDGARPTKSKVVSTYFDTGDARLARRGYSLRLREKREGFELTLKHEGDEALARGEWTSRVLQREADIRLLPEEAPRRDIGTVLPEELKPRFTTEIERTKKRIELDGAVIEACLDVGRIVSGDRAMPVAELEFELVSGSAPVMLEQARALLRHRSFAVSTRSKAARGIEIADAAPPPPVKAVKPQLAESDTVEQALAKIVAVTVRQIIGNLAAAADGCDPEGVHQLRVALRRLRSTCSLFADHLSSGAALLDEDAKRALKELGAARDLDVLLGETVPPVLDSETGHPGLLKLADIAEEHRREAYAAVRRLTGERWFNRFLIDLLLAAEDVGSIVRDGGEPLRPTAEALLRKRHRKVLKLGRNFADLTSRERHKVRIAAKKLRYACDYFQGVLPKKRTRAYVKRLVGLQDDLGHLNDASVARHLVDRLAGDDRLAGMGAALVTGWYAHRLRAVEPHMLGAWRQFAEAKPFWRN